MLHSIKKNLKLYFTYLSWRYLTFYKNSLLKDAHYLISANIESTSFKDSIVSGLRSFTYQCLMCAPYCFTSFLWTSNQLVAETSTWQHTTLTTDKIHAPGWIRTHDLSRRAAADLHLRPRGHWDRQYRCYMRWNLFHAMNSTIRFF